jgi:hypothetical protein
MRNRDIIVLALAQFLACLLAHAMAWLHYAIPLIQSISCEFLGRLNMTSHPHDYDFNMEPCIVCGANRLAHIQTGVEKRSSNKTEMLSQAVLWQI